MNSNPSREHIKSIFLISLPRSLSHVIYRTICQAVDLQEPKWTGNGEILNVDRFVFAKEPQSDFGRKYTVQSSEPKTFDLLSEFLDQIVSRFGFAYKDVVQPFVVSRWLQKNTLPVIRIKRHVAEVAFSMLQRGWFYPRSVAAQVASVESALLHGLIEAEKHLDSITGTHIAYDQLIYDDTILDHALRELYPEERIEKISYITDSFRSVREATAARKDTYLYGRLLELSDVIQRQKATILTPDIRDSERL